MPKQIDTTQTFSIHPSGATNTVNMTASSSYPASNAYTDSNSTTYARYTLSRSTAGYTNYTFTLPEIPAGATITSLTATVKVYVNNTGYVTDTICQFYTNTTAKGSNYTFASTNSSNVVNMTNTGTWTVAELQNLRLRIGGTGGSQNNSKYITVYGATVTITYRVQGTAYTIDTSSSINGITIEPSTQDILGGNSGTVLVHASDSSEFNITDNGINIFNQLVEYVIDGEETAIPSSYTNLSSGVTINSSYPIANAYNDSSQTALYARLDFNTSITGYIELLFDFSEIPANASITSITARARLRVSSTSRMTNTICRLYTGNIAKGSNITFATTSATQYTLTPGSWTRSELSDLRMRIGATSTNSTSSKYIYIYGADITIEYSANGKHYTYTISNINADHTIIIAEIPTEKFYLKSNGAWINVNKIYLKSNGTWTQVALSYLSDNNIQYLIQGQYSPPVVEETWETIYDDYITWFHEDNGDYPYCWLGSLADIYPEEGSVWRITYNNIQYRCVGVIYAINEYGQTAVCIGNPKWGMMEDDGTDVPFVFNNVGWGAWTGSLNAPNNVDTQTYYFKIERLVE